MTSLPSTSRCDTKPYCSGLDAATMYGVGLGVGVGSGVGVGVGVGVGAGVTPLTKSENATGSYPSSRCMLMHAQRDRKTMRKTSSRISTMNIVMIT